jgi:hypothetical protein
MKFDRNDVEKISKKEAAVIRACGEYLIDHADDIAYKAGYLTPDGGQIILNLYATEIPTITIRHEAFIEK